MSRMQRSVVVLVLASLAATSAPLARAQQRPLEPTSATVTTEPLTYRQLAGVWGVVPVLADVEDATYEGLMGVGRDAIIRSGAGDPGAPVVITAGFPFQLAGTTNTMRVERL